jgi:hypothetical protein
MTHDYDPSWDYEIETMPVAAVVTAVEAAKSELEKTAAALGLGMPTIHFVRGLDKRHLARYISGTSSEPVFVLDTHKLARGAVRNHLSLEAVVVPTLKHELAHAYLETWGLESEDGTEELVERFAEICWQQGDEAGVEWLKVKIEADSPKVD